MIVVRVELWSAITGKVTEIARMDIANVGGTATRGDYRVRTIRGRDKETLDSNWQREVFTRGGHVKNYPRQTQHVWNLVARALESMRYGSRRQMGMGPTDAIVPARKREGRSLAKQ